jgi:putative methyltransferase
MSLYYETATILLNPEKAGGSFKARIFKKKDLKSKPGQIYALVAESSKWSRVLKGVIEGCGVLGEERKVREPYLQRGRSFAACITLLEKR